MTPICTPAAQKNTIYENEAQHAIEIELRYEVLKAEQHRHSNIGWFASNQLPTQITEHALQALDALKTRKRFSVNS